MNNSGKTTIWVVIISLFSKVLALVSNTMFLTIFGVSNPLLNVYMYAIQIPNTIFNSVGTTLNTVIIPIYTSSLAQGEDKTAKKFLDDIISIATLIIIVLVVAAMVLAPVIASFAGDKVDKPHLDYLAFTLRILMPVMLFYGLNYIFQGVLQSHGQFKLPAFVSAPSSLAVILYLVLFAKIGGITGLTVATVIGLALQPLIMVPSIKKIGYQYKPSFDFKNPQIRMAAKLTLPVLVSISSYQINFLFNNTMAFRFGTLPIMGYSQQLVEKLMLTIVYALSSVYFPKLTRQWAAEQKPEFRDTLSEILQNALFIILPAACGFWLLKYDIMNLLLNWKNDPSTDILMAGNMLGLYSIAFIAVSLKEVLDKAFYSGKNTKMPAVFGFVIMAVNISVTFILIKPLGTYSMPVAYVVSAFTGMAGLLYKMNKRVQVLNRAFILTLVKCIVCVAVMGLAVQAVILATNTLFVVSEFITKLATIGIRAVSGVVIYLVMAYLLKVPALKVFTAGFSKRNANS